MKENLYCLFVTQVYARLCNTRFNLAHVTLAVMIIRSKVSSMSFSIFFMYLSYFAFRSSDALHVSKCMQYMRKSRELLLRIDVKSPQEIYVRSYPAGEKKSLGRKFPRFTLLSAGSFSWLVIRQFVIILACLAASSGNLKAP